MFVATTLCLSDNKYEDVHLVPKDQGAQKTGMSGHCRRTVDPRTRTNIYHENGRFFAHAYTNPIFEVK